MSDVQSICIPSSLRDLIPGGQNLNNRQTVFFLLVVPIDKNHKDRDTIDLNAPRHAQYIHKAWKKHQNTVYWFDINLALRKRLKFDQPRSNAIILYDTLPAYCIPKVDRLKTGEVLYEKVYASPRPPPKISLKHDWKRLGSEDGCSTTRGISCATIISSQSNQPNPNPDHDRTEKPVDCPQKRSKRSIRSQEIETRSFHEEAVKHDRTVRPVVETSRTQTRSFDDSKSFNVEDKAAHDRTGLPVVSCHTENVPDGCQTSSCHESTSFNVGDETIHDRTGQHVVNRDESGHEQTMLNEVNMDFRTPGLPHSVVKQAESSRVRELVKKIENHPDRQFLQRDLQKTKPTTCSVRRPRK